MRARLVVAVSSAAVGAAALAYVRLYRPWQVRWGATEEEVARTLPGDEIVADPQWLATRAVTIEAAPARVWPWLVQLGWGRAGFYGFDRVDNGGKPSAREIRPELQDLHVGSRFPLSPVTWCECTAFEPERWMIWRLQGSPTSGTWLWYLDPTGDGRTRLITRFRDHYRWTSPAIVGQLATEVFDLPFMRACMLGIKARAELASRDAVSLPGGVEFRGAARSSTSDGPMPA